MITKDFSKAFQFLPNSKNTRRIRKFFKKIGHRRDRIPKIKILHLIRNDLQIKQLKPITGWDVI